MLKRILFFLLCLSLVIISQVPAVAAANTANSHVRIESYNDQFDIMRTDFSYVNDFSNGRAEVSVSTPDGSSSKSGFINRKGEIVIPVIYDIAVPFNEGITCVGNRVNKNGKYTFDGKIIDINGKVIHKTNHAPKDGNSFNDGILMTDYTTYITAQDKVIFTAKSMSFPSFKEANCSEGLIPVSVVTGWDYTLGIIDKSGKWVVKDLGKIKNTFKYGGRFSQVGEFHEGLAAFKTTEGEWGYLDRTGKVVANDFDGVGDFFNGLAVARKDTYYKEDGHVKHTTNYGIIDKNFKWVIEPKYFNISNLEDGVITVGTYKDFTNIDMKKLDTNHVGAQTYGVMDIKENMIVPFLKYNVIYGFSEGLALYTKGLYKGELRTGYMDTKGNEVIEFDWGEDSEYRLGNDFHDGMAQISYKDKSGDYKQGYLMKRDSSSTIRVKLDGKFINLAIDPVSENGSTLVPFRALFEALGVKVDWDGATKTITGTKGDIEIKLQQDSKDAHINGQLKTLSVPVKAINGNTFVPVRFVSESLGLKVEWDNINRIVKLTTN